MVLRDRKINNKVDTVKLSISFSVPDVKALLKVYANMGANPEPMSYKEDEFSIRYWLEHDGRAFLSYPQKWREQLSAWCFATAVRNKLIVPTATDENKYYLAECLYKKRGRPSKKEPQ